MLCSFVNNAFLGEVVEQDDSVVFFDRTWLFGEKTKPNVLPKNQVALRELSDEEYNLTVKLELEVWDSYHKNPGSNTT